MVSRGTQKQTIEFFGGAFLLSLFIFIGFNDGLKGLFIGVLIFWFLVTPIVEFLLEKIVVVLYGRSRTQNYLFDTTGEEKPRKKSTPEFSQVGRDALVKFLKQTGVK